MKKLMTMVGAFAMAFGLFADDLPNPEVDAVDFATTDDATFRADTQWTWNGGSIADAPSDKVWVADNNLNLETGTNVLSRSFTEDGSAVAAFTDEIYLDANINFDLPCTDVPVLEASDNAKIAAFVLDNSDYIDEQGALVEKSTNLYVIAGYYNDATAGWTQRLFMLDTANMADKQTKRLTVKLYKDVMDGDTARLGFRFFMAGDNKGLKAVYAIPLDENGAPVFTAAASATANAYLGIEPSALVGGVRSRYEDRTLFLGLSGVTTISGMDIVGKGKLANFSLSTENPGFIPGDSSTVTLDLTGAEVTSVTGDNVIDWDQKSIIFGSGNLTVTAAYDTGATIVKWMLGDADVTKDVVNNAYTWTAVNGETLSITAVAPAAYVDGQPYATIAEAYAAANHSGKALVLAGAVTGADFDGLFAEGDEIILDLNGNTFTGSDFEAPAIFNQGTLTITNSTGTGVVVPADDGTLAVANSGTLTIAAGQFDGDVYWTWQDAGSAAIIGGDFKKSDVNTDTEIAKYIDDTKYEVVDMGKQGYWTVQEKQSKQDFGGGSGTDVDPYIIATADHLTELQTKVAAGDTFADKFFLQTADINMADAGIWYGIGPKNDLAHSFAGKYDGQNHRIYNITYAHVEYCGLFRGLNEGAELKNLTIESLGIAAKADGDDDRFGGGLFVGFAQGVTLENLTAKGALYGIWVANEKQGLGYNGGGIAMKVNGTSFVRNCTNEAEIVLSYTKAGGIVGFTQSISKNETTTFENCVNKGKIEILASGNNGVGGILGWANASVVMNNCASLGEIDIADGLTGTVVGSMIGQYDGGVCTVGAGNTTTVLDMVPSKGAVAISGFNFATVANGVATFQPTLAKDTAYTQMVPITSDAAIFTLEAAGDTFILNTNGLAFAGTVVAKDETLVVTPAVTDTTITWTAAAAQTDPIPPVNPSATPTEVNEAVDAANFADTTVKAMIGGDATKYIAFKTWAGTVTGGEEAVVASTLAAKSFEMSSVAEAHLFTNDPKIEITETTVGDSWTATVAIKDGVVPVAAIKAIEDQVQVTTTIETANSWGKATATAVINEGIATITITKPGDTKGFMRVKAAK